MIRTADALAFNVAVLQRCAAVRTVRADQTDAPLAVAKQHEFFVEHFNGLRNIAKIARGADGQPVAAKPSTRRRAAADVRKVGETRPALRLRLYGTCSH